MKDVITVTGRILFAVVFILAGLYKLDNFSNIQAILSNNGLPATNILLSIALAFQIICGLSMMLGYKARWAAMLMIIYLVIASYFMHRNVSDISQMTLLMKNLAIIGGLLFLFYNGSGALSLDNRM